MAISVADRKKLHGRAGGECSFPECQDRRGLQEAHIIAKEAGGPRADQSIPKQKLDKYDNVILLCPTHHHAVVDAEPVIKGQTATSSHKPAILENGARTMVPPHIEVGTRVVVNTADGSYVERAKD